MKTYITVKFLVNIDGDTEILTDNKDFATFQEELQNGIDDHCSLVESWEVTDFELL